MSFAKAPKNKAFLKELALEPAQCLAYCDADLNLQGEFQEFRLILTAHHLIFVTMTPTQGEKVFAGYIQKNRGRAMPASMADSVAFSLETIETMELQDLIAGGLVFLKTAGGEQRLCCATGQYTAGLRQFRDIFQKVKEEKELTEEDYKTEERPEFCDKCGTPYIDRERKICPKCTDHRSLFMRTFSYFTPYKWKILAVMLLITVSSVCSAVMPYLSGAVYFDDVLGKKSTFTGVWSLAAGDFFVLLGLVMGGFLVIRLITMFTAMLQFTAIAKIVPRVVKDIKQDVFAALRRLSLKFFTDRQTGPLMTRVLGDAGEVTGFFIDGLPYIFGDVIHAAVLLVMMFSLSWQLTVMAIAVVPVVTVVSNLLRPMLWHLHGKRHRANRSMNGVLNDTLTGARVIKAFGKETGAIASFETENAKMMNTEVSVVAYENRYFALSSVGSNLLTLGVWAIGSWLILRAGYTQMSYGMLAAFLTYVGMLSELLQRMSDLFRWATSSMNAAQRIFEILDAKPDVVEKKDPVVLPTIRGEVALHHVTFSYEPGKPVLKDISVTVPAGQMLGIVGRSGVGKSTLVSLIARLYDTDSGSITIDGVDIRDLSMETLHRCVSTVSQDSYMFMGTVAENIAYVRQDAPREEIIRAAMAAGAHDFICKMPDGYDTVIGSGGRQLSGGERQRLSVARAILADSPILILDEATASVDTATERKIQNALDRLVQGRTTLSIAHRLSTLRGADRLAVMDGGEIKEYGTHRELMEQQGIYYKLVELQTKALSLEGRAAAKAETIVIE